MSNFSIFDADEFHSSGVISENTIFRTATDFSQFVELTAAKSGVSLTQVILDYCDNRDVDYEDISKLLSTNLKEKLAFEMQEAGLLPRQSTLEF